MDATPPPQATRIEMQHCPACHHAIDAVTSPFDPECDTQMDHDTVAKPGDLTICVYCSALLEFDEHLHIQRIDPRTLAAMTPSTRHKLELTRAMVRNLGMQA